MSEGSVPPRAYTQHTAIFITPISPLLFLIISLLLGLQGVAAEVRAEVWLYLLNVYPFNSTTAERNVIKTDLA